MSELGGIGQSDLQGQELNSNLREKVKMFQMSHNINGQSEIETYNMLVALGPDALAKVINIESTQEIEIKSQKEERELTWTEKTKIWRDKLEKKARSFDYKFGYKHGTWNTKVKRHFNWKGRKEMRLEEIQAAYQWLVQEAKKQAEVFQKIQLEAQEHVYNELAVPV